MIFAAGLGTRFKPWTDEYPKALAIVNGKTLLQRNIEYLQKYGIRDVVVNVHHFADQIIDTVLEFKGWKSNVIISDESGVLLETGGGLMKAKSFLEGIDPFITLNVDILTDLNLDALIQFHEQHKSLVSFGVTDRETSRYFLLDKTNRLCGWKNTKTGEEKIVIDAPNLHPKAYSCVAIYQQEFFSLVRQQGKFSLTETFLDLAPDHLILGYDHSGDNLIDVGRQESVAIAEEIFK